MPTIIQLSVLLENQGGALAKLARILSKAGYEILALSIAELDGFGACRLVLADAEGASRLLRSKGYSVRLSRVLAVRVPEGACALNDLLSIFQDAAVSLEYLYSFAKPIDGKNLLILSFEDMEEAASALTQKGVRLIDMEEVLSS
ncbi:MAG: hypothetical protein II875_02910 [Clostridia bacterium]|nr:hypothetical protein [Clostridia bacterium]